MFKMDDTVRIKKTGVVGSITDISCAGGSTANFTPFNTHVVGMTAYSIGASSNMPELTVSPATMKKADSAVCILFSTAPKKNLKRCEN